MAAWARPRPHKRVKLRFPLCELPVGHARDVTDVSNSELKMFITCGDSYAGQGPLFVIPQSHFLTVTMVTYVIEVHEVRFDLQGCLEAVVASEVAIRAHTI